MPCKMQARASVGIIQHRLKIRAVMNIPPPSHDVLKICNIQGPLKFSCCFFFFLIGVVSFLAGLSLGF